MTDAPNVISKEGEAEVKAANDKRDAHLNNLRLLRTETRLERIEAWIYDMGVCEKYPYDK